MTEIYILDIVYLVASVLFVIGLKMLSAADTARKGNLVAAAGMFLAIVATIFIHPGKEVSGLKLGLIFGGIAIGTVGGWLAAKKVQMTKMPELVSIFNGMGGACAALISVIEYPNHIDDHKRVLLTVLLGLFIGSVSFAGSIIAFLKLNGTLNKPVRLPSYNIINLALVLGIVALIGAVLFVPSLNTYTIVIGLLLLSLVYGVLFVLPIGGADMPVVISLLNSFTGVAAAFGGFLYNNQVMLTGGILVGSAGTLLTIVMCKAMNRPLFSVVFGAFGASNAVDNSTTGGSVKDISISDLATLMYYSKKVVIVPGYGLAVAQAQQIIRELETILEENGVEVKYAIHPVAGRMPGHMNVLLAESNVPYEKLVEMDDINPEFPNTDVVFVVGANDVVNPAAKTNPASPIYGMPVLDVELAHHIIVNKRSMNAGYAGIDNELFYNPKTSMLFGDAKKALTDLVNELKSM